MGPGSTNEKSWGGGLTQGHRNGAKQKFSTWSKKSLKAATPGLWNLLMMTLKKEKIIPYYKVFVSNLMLLTKGIHFHILNALS